MRHIHHLGLHVNSIERSISFYTEVLGLELLSRRRSTRDYVAKIVGYPDAELDMAWLRLPGDDQLLELIEYLTPTGVVLDVSPPNSGSAHIAFGVSNIWREVERLERLGVAFTSGPVQITAGANRGGWAVYFRDPDGVTLELIQPAQER